MDQKMNTENSLWPGPSEEQIAEWLTASKVRATDDCWVEPGCLHTWLAFLVNPTRVDLMPWNKIYIQGLVRV